MGTKLLTTLVALAFATQLATAQQKSWTEIILNYHGKDTILYKDSKIEVDLFKEGEEYKYIPAPVTGYAAPAQHAIPWNRAEADKALKIKNTIQRHATLEDAMNYITRKDELTGDYRLLSTHVKEYFDVLSETFPKNSAGVGQKVIGAERTEYEKCKVAAEKDLEVTKKNNQSTEGLDYLITFLSEKLGEKKTIMDEKNGIKLAKDKDGNDIYAVFSEYAPSKYGEFADNKALPLINTQKILFHYADSVLKTKVETYKGKILWDKQLTPEGNYKVLVLYWQIGTEKQDKKVKATISETYDLIEKK